MTLISELKGQFITTPLLSLSLAVSLFSMAGIPPLVGFFAKAQLLYSSTQNGYYFISIVAILVSVISAYYYLQIIRVMHFDTPNLSQGHTAYNANGISDMTRPALTSEGGVAATLVPSLGKGVGVEGSTTSSCSMLHATCSASSVGYADSFNPNLAITNTHSFLISIITLSLLLFILKPSILLNSIHLMALNIFYF
jgi:NADH-ubiquinone oxidoreductase chain 2